MLCARGTYGKKGIGVTVAQWVEHPKTGVTEVVGSNPANFSVAILSVAKQLVSLTVFMKQKNDVMRHGAITRLFMIRKPHKQMVLARHNWLKEDG